MEVSRRIWVLKWKLNADESFESNDVAYIKNQNRVHIIRPMFYRSMKFSDSFFGILFLNRADTWFET